MTAIGETPPARDAPDAVRRPLAEAGGAADYAARPPYQRIDYLGGIARVKFDETRHARIEQMIDELKHGGVYMDMTHAPSAKV